MINYKVTLGAIFNCYFHRKVPGDHKSGAVLVRHTNANTYTSHYSSFRLPFTWTGSFACRRPRTGITYASTRSCSPGTLSVKRIQKGASNREIKRF